MYGIDKVFIITIIVISPILYLTYLDHGFYSFVVAAGTSMTIMLIEWYLMRDIEKQHIQN